MIPNDCNRCTLFSFAISGALCTLYGLPATAASPNNQFLDLSLDELMNVVTVRKREEKLVDVPVAVTHFPEQMLHDYDINSFIDYASKSPNVSFAYGNGLTAGNPATGWSSARTIAIRGVSGARTSGFYIDDIPLPGSLNVRLRDLNNIEILKGPQGTLFGESSLGGNIRLITKSPDLDLSSFTAQIAAGKTRHSGAGNGETEVVGNLLLAPGTVALRLVANVESAGGYLSRNYLTDFNNPQSARIDVGNQGAQRSASGSIAGLLRLTPDVDLAVRYIAQRENYRGFPATWAPLPAFEPQQTVDHLADLQPTVSDRWRLPSISLTWRQPGWTLNSTTSLFNRQTRDVEDSTEGTLQLTGAPRQPFAWAANYRSRQLAHETRITFEPVHNFSGTIGVFYSKHRTEYEIPAVYDRLTQPSTLLWAQTDFNTQQDFSIFGELYYKFADSWTLTLGNRWYRLQQTDTQTVLGDAGQTTYSENNASRGNSPKLALAYQWSDQAMLYGSATKGFRQGNAQLDPSAFNACGTSMAAIGETAESLKKIKPDSVWSYELGAKLNLPDPGLMLTASVFQIHWRDMQQQLLLQSCGLFIQGNAGTAKINGGEVELTGRLTSALKLRLSLGYQDARITQAGNTGQPVGSRVYQTPQWTTSVGGVYTTRLNDRYTGTMALDYSYSSNSISANNGPLNLVRAGYGLANVRASIGWDKSELGLAVTNLTNARPNLGDLTYIGYGLFTDASRSVPVPQVATLPPRTFMLHYSERF